MASKDPTIREFFAEVAHKIATPFKWLARKLSPKNGFLHQAARGTKDGAKKVLKQAMISPQEYASEISTTEKIGRTTGKYAATKTVGTGSLVKRKIKTAAVATFAVTTLFSFVSGTLTGFSSFSHYDAPGAAAKVIHDTCGKNWDTVGAFVESGSEACSNPIGRTAMWAALWVPGKALQIVSGAATGFGCAAGYAARDGFDKLTYEKHIPLKKPTPMNY